MDDISKEIAQALSDYTEEVTEGLEEAKKEVAKETVSELKQTSPQLTGDYASGWAKKKMGSAQVVYNKTDYQLTHLLEFGHAKRGGGRVQGQPHIGKAEEKAIESYQSKVERKIQG